MLFYTENVHFFQPTVPSHPQSNFKIFKLLLFCLPRIEKRCAEDDIVTIMLLLYIVTVKILDYIVA